MFGRAVASNRVLAGLAVRFSCDEHILIRILESELLPMRLRQNNAVFLTFRALLTDESLLKRLLGDEQFADTILLRNDFVRYALGNHSALKQAENHPAIVSALMRNRKVWHQLTSREDFLEFVADPGQYRRILAENDGILEELLNDEAFIERILNHKSAAERLSSHGPLLERALSRVDLVDRVVRDDALLMRLLVHPRAVEKIATDDRIVTGILSHGLVFQKLLSDDTLLTKLLGSERAFDKTLADPVLLGRLLNHGRTIETIALTPPVLQKLTSMESVIHHTAHSDSIFQRWASNSDVMEALRRSPRLLGSILNHGAAIEGLASLPEFLAQTQASDRYIHNLLRGQRMTQRLVADTVDSERVRAIQDFHETWKRFAPVVDTKRPGLDEQLLNAAWNLNHVKDVREAVLRVITKDKTAMLAHGEMRYTDDFSLWTLIHEILLNEEYYFETDSDEPYVLDCGANFGMAVYYFKSLYPRAHVTAFEPAPALRKMAQENAKRNNFADVEVLPYALAGDEGEATFYVSEEYPLANTLTTRRHEMGDTLNEIKVEKKRLSHYLDRPVDFLKLDIEGAEDAVLAECKSKLKRVRSLFIEYHHGAGMEARRLVKTLRILDEAGFDYHLQKAFNFGESTARRPLARVEEPYSLVIWGKNRSWESGS